jgi:hypothetical protein
LGAEELNDKVSALQAEFERLEAEFQSLQHGGEHGEHEDGEEHEEGEHPLDHDDFDGEEHAELEEGSAGIYGETGGGDDVHEPNDMGDATPGYGEPEGIYEDEDEDFEDLDESQSLDYLHHVGRADTTDGEEIGSGGKKVGTNKKSPIPQEPVEARLHGIEGNNMPSRTKGSIHKGFDREAAPSTKKFPPMVNDTRTNKQYLKHKDKEGGEGKAAVINRSTSDGFGAVGTKSSIGSVGSRNESKRKGAV